MYTKSRTKRIVCATIKNDARTNQMKLYSLDTNRALNSGRPIETLSTVNVQL